MTAYTIDARVVAKWFIPEIHTEHAVKLLEDQYDLFVPDLLHSELGNVLWKKVRKKELTVSIALEIINSLNDMPLRLVPSKELLPAAFDIAYSLDRTVYDSLYLAAACDRDAPLVTADLKFYNVIKHSPFKDNIVWLEDL